MSYASLSLVPQRFIRIGEESRIYKNLPLNPNFVGAVKSVEFPPDNNKFYILDSGVYLVDFDSKLPFDCFHPPYFHIQQDKLFMSGASITLNLNPFQCLLNIRYRLLIEAGASIANLIYDVPDIV